MLSIAFSDKWAYCVIPFIWNAESRQNQKGQKGRLGDCLGCWRWRDHLWAAKSVALGNEMFNTDGDRYIFWRIN